VCVNGKLQIQMEKKIKKKIKKKIINAFGPKARQSKQTGTR